MRILAAVGLVAAGLLATAGPQAKSPVAPQARPQAFDALIRCRAIADEKARLQCFDTAAAALEQAAERRDVVVVDRKQMREARHTLFGLDIPRLNIFGGGDDADEVKQIDGVVAAASQDGNGRWIVRLEDGGTWAQTDFNTIAMAPTRGSKVTIRKAAMGSYMMRVGSQPGVRVKRQI